MKIKLFATSENYDMYKELLSKYGYEENITYTDWYEPDWLHAEKYRYKIVNATIEINSLEELFELIGALPNKSKEIIINNDDTDPDSPFIEIYDNWRE